MQRYGDSLESERRITQIALIGNMRTVRRKRRGLSSNAERKYSIPGRELETELPSLAVFLTGNTQRLSSRLPSP
jgi:hypothetical protein